MKRSGFSEDQIIAILKQHEGGATTADVCREHGLGTATSYNQPSKAPSVRVGRRTKARFGRMDVSDVRKLKALEVVWPPTVLVDCGLGFQRSLLECRGSWTGNGRVAAFRGVAPLAANSRSNT